MIRSFVQFLDRPGSIYALITGYVLSAVLQGLAFVQLIWFLRDFLGTDPATSQTSLLILLGLGIAAFIVHAITATAANKISATEVVGNTISRIGSRVSQLPLGWFNAETAGKISSAVSNQTSTLSHVASILLPHLISTTVAPATMIIVLWFVEFRLALVLTIVVVVVAFLGRWANSLLLKEQKVAPAVNAKTAGRILEQAKLQPVLRARGLVGTQWQPVDDALDEEQKTLGNIMRAQARPTLSFIVVAQVMFAVVLAYGLSLVLDGQLDVAAYIGIAVMAARFTGPISQLSNYATDFQNANVALESINEILIAPTLPEPTQPRMPTSTDIQLNSIRFGYTESTPLFKDFSLTANAGEITAVVGPSGCGKTTITKLVARFWDVAEGSITIGGVDVCDISTDQLMDMTAIVFQDVYLFDTTIKENVRISRPDATDEEVAEAMRRAGLDHVLEYLPDGADTQVGEGGKSLSGGERQRVSIARAFLKDAPILLLDEVTSALDTENEASITASLLDLAQGRTVIIIAHRLSTVMNADQVYVLSGRDSGEPTHVVESGKPTELAKQDGPFAAMLADFKEVSRWQI
ncbi:ABC transporter ATP-binding protein [Corynebacterium cystitidis]|uniref:ATP-binding cassette, subfamily B n=1 Tax=Corynebacterium cystitidis DSM 20524 TaxID=1121357 RepID=A0A1H9RCD4_9CORY|nr:ABC transporter ATP-binding protein [Corynebacterium cystitidis]WJY81483.1 Iron import ATP-binding/permease protein IrtB [Corynebacterium cystitidis DSM 20524]SER70354.1 ATP-binding cassette, subfamily B [Corynebacterium cystitidis DSM 20524]SNV87064.1 ABC transporter ATP-binding protein/permease [Corynebacterium cystitidis]